MVNREIQSTHRKHFKNFEELYSVIIETTIPKQYICNFIVFTKNSVGIKLN